MHLRLAEEAWHWTDNDLALFICIFLCAVGIGAVMHFTGRR
jgi:cell division protein FtsL